MVIAVTPAVSSVMTGAVPHLRKRLQRACRAHGSIMLSGAQYRNFGWGIQRASHLHTEAA